jgi:hypothetical protein
MGALLRSPPVDCVAVWSSPPRAVELLIAIAKNRPDPQRTRIIMTAATKVVRWHRLPFTQFVAYEANRPMFRPFLYGAAVSFFLFGWLPARNATRTFLRGYFIGSSIGNGANNAYGVHRGRQGEVQVLAARERHVQARPALSVCKNLPITRRKLTWKATRTGRVNVVVEVGMRVWPRRSGRAIGADNVVLQE